jgi:hypothetical protein
MGQLALQLQVQVQVLVLVLLVYRVLVLVRLLEMYERYLLYQRFQKQTFHRHLPLMMQHQHHHHSQYLDDVNQ